MCVRQPVRGLARGVVAFTSAVSVVLTRTVTMSPTWAARWSLKKARLPLRQSALACGTATWAAGIGMVSGR